MSKEWHEYLIEEIRENRNEIKKLNTNLHFLRTRVYIMAALVGSLSAEIKTTLVTWFK